MMPLVSVIIPIYNRTEYVCEAIDSVLAQTYKNYEIVVVDDGSITDVKRVLKPYRAKIKCLYQENKGLAAARNYGIKNSNGKYLAFLDDDDLFEPRKLEIQVPVLEDNPEVGFVYSDCYGFEAENRNEKRLNLATGRDRASNEFANLYFIDTNVLVPTVLIRRKCFEDVGLFDENLPQNEDVDMWLRVALRWQVKFSDYPSALVRRHSNRMSLDRVETYDSLIKSWQKILKIYPNFRKDLGTDANRRIANLHYLLAQAYLGRNKIKEARNEFISCTKILKLFKLKAYFYILILSLGKASPDLFLSVIMNVRRILRELFISPLRKGIRLMRLIYHRRSLRLIFIAGGTVSLRDVLMAFKFLWTRRNLQEGLYIQKFENALKGYLGVKYAISFHGARVALQAILEAMEIGEGDEVILPGYTCVVVPNALLFRGIHPIYVDITLDTYNISPSLLQKSLTPKTKAIIIQYTYGLVPSNVDALIEIAHKNGIGIIEDCASALGATYKEKKVGTLGDAAIFSTEQTKCISTQFGGFAVTNDSQIGEKLLKIQKRLPFPDDKQIRVRLFQFISNYCRWHPIWSIWLTPAVSRLQIFFGPYIPGMNKYELSSKEPYNHYVVMPNALASLGIRQLKYIDQYNTHRRSIAMLYQQILSEHAQIPRLATNGGHIFLRYPVIVKDRGYIIREASNKGIQLGEWFNSVIHPKGAPLDKLMYIPGSCSQAEHTASNVINLPTHPAIIPKEAQEIAHFVLKLLHQLEIGGKYNE
ncbi:UDP-4-amino-4-deoxy-L-arabinose--oxoglutarate aminotransferase [subsurface metagenome]